MTAAQELSHEDYDILLMKAGLRNLLGVEEILDSILAGRCRDAGMLWNNLMLVSIRIAFFLEISWSNMSTFQGIEWQGSWRKPAKPAKTWSDACPTRRRSPVQPPCHVGPLCWEHAVDWRHQAAARSHTRSFKKRCRELVTLVTKNAVSADWLRLEGSLLKVIYLGLLIL